MRDRVNTLTRYERSDIQRLRPLQWQIDALNMNPDYCQWGPGEDYMSGPREEGGWNTAIEVQTWDVFEIEPDDLNEFVNFHFELRRESVRCVHCGGDGTHAHARWVTESFYRHSSPFEHDEEPPQELFDLYGIPFRRFVVEMRRHRCWNDRITTDEVEALWRAHRVGQGGPMPSREQVNEAQRGPGMGHDGINRWILCETRCNRLKIPTACPDCEGHGHIYTAATAHLSLVLWLLHPRKGASRGVTIHRIEEPQLPAVYQFLRTAADRNAERFSRIPVVPTTE